MLGLALLGLLAVLAVRSVRPRDSGAGVGSSAVAARTRPGTVLRTE